MPSVGAAPMPPARQGSGLATAALVLSLIAAPLLLLGGIAENVAIYVAPYANVMGSGSAATFSIDIDFWSLVGWVIPTIPWIAMRALGFVVAGLLVWEISHGTWLRSNAPARVAVVVAAVLMLCDAVPYLFNAVSSGQLFSLMPWNYDSSALGIVYWAFETFTIFPGYLVAVLAAVLSIISALLIKPPLRPRSPRHKRSRALVDAVPRFGMVCYQTAESSSGIKQRDLPKRG